VRWPGDADEAALEHRVRLFAPPLVLGLAWLAMQSEGLRSLFRLVSSMWLHELGHAVAAWVTGFVAFPGPWRTSIEDERSRMFIVVVAAALAAGAWWYWRQDRRRLAVILGVTLLAQLVLSFLVSEHHAKGFILFGGDAGALVFGTVLVATFWSSPGTKLHDGWLRWGFLPLGALGFFDPFTLWWRARRDPDVIPFGEIEGVGHSDPSRLADDHGWSVKLLVSRYVLLGVVCLLVMIVLYVRGLLRKDPEP
jgi:hypothetical protein